MLVAGLVASLLGQDIVLVLDYEVYVVAEVLVETVKLGAQVFVEFELLDQQLLDACF